MISKYSPLYLENISKYNAQILNLHVYCFPLNFLHLQSPVHLNQLRLSPDWLKCNEYLMVFENGCSNMEEFTHMLLTFLQNPHGQTFAQTKISPK